MKSKNTILSLALSCLLASTQSYVDTNVGAYVNYDGWNLNIIDQFNADTARNAGTINCFQQIKFL